MPTVYQRALEQRAALLRRDKEVAARLIDAYKTVEDDLLEKLKAVTDLIELRRANGEDVSLAWLYRQERYQEFLNQTRDKMADLAEMCGDETVKAQRVAVDAGFSDATELIRLGADEVAVTGSFLHQPQRAVDNMVSSLTDDAPLTALLESLKKDAVEKAKNALITGVASGSGIPVITANFRAATGASLSKSLLIARTETLRAYRTAALQTYQESDLVESWIWTSTLETHTCAACLALHNTVHAKDEAFASHPACRCCPRPLVAGGKVRGQDGEQWFESQDEETKKRILGPKAYEEYKAGNVGLRDFVKYRDHDEYGRSVQRASIADAKAAHGGNYPPGSSRPSTPLIAAAKPAGPAAGTAVAARQAIQAVHDHYQPQIDDIESRKQLIKATRDRAWVDGDFSTWRKLNAEVRDMSAQADALREKRLAEMRQHIYVSNPATLAVQYESKVLKQGERGQRIAQGLDEFAKMVGTGSLDQTTIRVFPTRDKRSYHFLGSIYMNKQAETKVIVHEMGHSLEFYDAALLAKVQAFYDRRTAGEKTISMRAATGDKRYKANEVTKVDKWINPYIGKVYSSGRTEVVSMGMEMMWDDPQAFAARDSEHFDFIYDLLRGN